MILKGPCAQIQDKYFPKHLYRGYFKAKVYRLYEHKDPWALICSQELMGF